MILWGWGTVGRQANPLTLGFIVGLRTATQLEMRDLNHREGKGILDLVPTREVSRKSRVHGQSPFCLGLLKF